jgi:DNA-binding NarL/FixJ family response regulator
MRPRTTSSPLDRLTERERQVLALMAEGLTNAAISKRLRVGDRTLEAHVRQIFVKLTSPHPSTTTAAYSQCCSTCSRRPAER